MAQYQQIRNRGYDNDRSSAEAISVGAALAAVQSGECQYRRVIRELDALEETIADGGDEDDVASAERDVHAAWEQYVRAGGAS